MRGSAFLIHCIVIGREQFALIVVRVGPLGLMLDPLIDPIGHPLTLSAVVLMRVRYRMAPTEEDLGVLILMRG